MPNGKGTLDCHYCMHYKWGEPSICKRYEIEYPVEEAGYKNTVCADFRKKPFIKDNSAIISSDFRKLRPLLKKGMLYMFPYPARDYREVLEEAVEIERRK